MLTLLVLAVVGQPISQQIPGKGDQVTLLSTEKEGVSGWSELVHIVAQQDVLVPQGSIGTVQDKFASVTGVYYFTVKIPGTNPIVCRQEVVWRLTDVEKCKVIYRDIFAAAAKALVKVRPGSKKRANAAMTKEELRAIEAVAKLHAIDQDQVNAILTLGNARGWDVSDVVGEARRKVAAKAKANKVAGLLAIGASHEKNKNRTAALKAYREVVAKYPDSQEAKKAAERIKAIENP